jgi:hypothetical protein
VSNQLALPLDWCQRWSHRRHSWRHRREGGFDQRRYDWAVIDQGTAKAFCLEHHYAGSFPAATLSIAAFLGLKSRSAGQ